VHCPEKKKKKKKKKKKQKYIDQTSNGCTEKTKLQKTNSSNIKRWRDLKNKSSIR
jgi:hypothetical protein